LRNGEEIADSDILSIKREKEDVREVRENMECGITLRDFTDFEVGDVLEAYVLEKFGG
jgi:translation initiation factor IF-2